MDKVTAITTKEKYKTTITTATNSLIVDEPLDLGGKDLGPTPLELLAASLASCTSITLRMYADHKEWELDEIKVEVEQDRDVKTKTTNFKRQVYLKGNFDEKQEKRLLSVANACPVHKILMQTIEIQTQVYLK